MNGGGKTTMEIPLQGLDNNFAPFSSPSRPQLVLQVNICKSKNLCFLGICIIYMYQVVIIVFLTVIFIFFSKIFLCAFLRSYHFERDLGTKY